MRQDGYTPDGMRTITEQFLSQALSNIARVYDAMNDKYGIHDDELDFVKRDVGMIQEYISRIIRGINNQEAYNDAEKKARIS